MPFAPSLTQAFDPARNPSGVYRLADTAHPAPILTTVTDFGWHTGYINGRLVSDKQTFLAAAGQAMAFPSYYGRNWDAFEEMVNDLSWLGLRAAGQDGAMAYHTDYGIGCVLRYDEANRFATAQPQAWQTALTILQSASVRWQQEGVAFYVLLHQNRHWNRHLPQLQLPLLHSLD